VIFMPMYEEDIAEKTASGIYVLNNKNE